MSIPICIRQQRPKRFLRCLLAHGHRDCTVLALKASETKRHCKSSRLVLLQPATTGQQLKPPLRLKDSSREFTSLEQKTMILNPEYRSSIFADATQWLWILLREFLASVLGWCFACRTYHYMAARLTWPKDIAYCGSSCSVLPKIY